MCDVRYCGESPLSSGDSKRMNWNTPTLMRFPKSFMRWITQSPGQRATPYCRTEGLDETALKLFVGRLVRGKGQHDGTICDSSDFSLMLWKARQFGKVDEI